MDKCAVILQEPPRCLDWDFQLPSPINILHRLVILFDLVRISYLADSRDGQGNGPGLWGFSICLGPEPHEALSQLILGLRHLSNEESGVAKLWVS